MKNYIRLVVFIFIASFNLFKSYSQELIVHNSDTLVTLKPEKVRIINCIISDLETTKKLNKIQLDIIKNDSIIISKKDSIINNQESIMIKKDNYYNSSLNDLKESLKKSEKKKYIYSGAFSSLAILLGVLLIIK